MLVGEILDAKCWFGAMRPGYGRIHRHAPRFALAAACHSPFAKRELAAGAWTRHCCSIRMAKRSDARFGLS